MFFNCQPGVILIGWRNVPWPHHRSGRCLSLELDVLTRAIVPDIDLLVARVSEGARIETVELDLSGFESALDIYKRRNGRYPSEAEGLSVLYSEGILLGTLKQDPWGRDYVYAFPGRINPEGFDLYSLGASGDGIISHQAE